MQLSTWLLLTTSDGVLDVLLQPDKDTNIGSPLDLAGMGGDGATMFFVLLAGIKQLFSKSFCLARLPLSVGRTGFVEYILNLCPLPYLSF